MQYARVLILHASMAAVLAGCGSEGATRSTARARSSHPVIPELAKVELGTPYSQVISALGKPDEDVVTKSEENASRRLRYYRLGMFLAFQAEDKVTGIQINFVKPGGGKEGAYPGKALGRFDAKSRKPDVIALLGEPRDKNENALVYASPKGSVSFQWANVFPGDGNLKSGAGDMCMIWIHW
jgi:hypothetical protein